MGTAPKAAPVFEEPEYVPGYRDLTRIGHGGFSVVYRAVQESFERDVALKLLTIVGPDEDARRRFVREVRLSGRLSDHPHVVTVLDTGTTASGRPFLAMDLYDGGSMKQWLNRRGPLSGAQAAGVGAKIADALHAAHALGVLHRDVKPNNILVSRYGEPALADFGVSWLLDASSSSSVLDVFSPQHAAPELMTRGVPTASSDVYALGSTLYELVAGRPPFGGAGQDVRRTIYLALSEPAPRLECPDLPGFAEVIERAMAKEPEDRFPDAAAFGRALRGLIPDGRLTALVMEDPATATAAMPLELEMAAPPTADPARSVDMTDAMYIYSGDDDYVPRPDDTMVRPDRVDGDAPIPAPRSGGSRRRPDDRRGSSADGGRAGQGGRRGGHGERGAVAARGGDRRGVGKPLALVVAVLLVAVGAWALVSSQGSGSQKLAAGQSPTSAASGQSGASSAGQSTSTAATTRSSSSSSPSPTKHTSSSATPTHTVTTTAASSSAPVLPPATSATGPLLPSGYHRYQNSASGNCLSGAGVQACADVKAQGWEFTPPPGGLLNGLTGQEELVNGDSDSCLTGGHGGVGVKSCSGDPSQLWSKIGGSGGGTQLMNGADSLCLKASGGSVTEAACDGDPNELWSEGGNV